MIERWWFLVLFFLTPALIQADESFVKALRPQGGDLSGIWKFDDIEQNFKGKEILIFQAKDRLYGILEGNKTDHVLRGTVTNRKAVFEIAPMTIAGVEGDAPLDDDQKRKMLGRATIEYALEVSADSKTLSGEAAVWTYSTGSDTVTHDKKVTAKLTRAEDFASRKTEFNLSGKWALSANTSMHLWHTGGMVRGELNLPNTRRVFGYFKPTSPDPKVWPDLRLFEFCETQADFDDPKVDPVTYARVVEKQEYVILADTNHLEGRRSFTRYGTNNDTKRFAYAELHGWQPLKPERKGTLDSAQFLSMAGKDYVNFRLPGKNDHADCGKIRIRAKGPGSNPVTFVTVYSDTDHEGWVVPLSPTNPGEYESEEPLVLRYGAPSEEGVLRVTPGDRVRAKVPTHPLMNDPVWVTGWGGDDPGDPEECRAALAPLWRVPLTRQQYAGLLDKYVLWKPIENAGHVRHFTVLMLSGTPPEIQALLSDTNYMTPEEVIVAKWKTIELAAKKEKVPACLIAAVLLQNMRSMNMADLIWDGKLDGTSVVFGKTVGISQTPYYVFQKIVKDRGIDYLDLPQGTALENGKAVELLFDADISVCVAAANIAMVSDRALKYYANANLGAPAKAMYQKNFDLSIIRATGPVSEDERKVAGLVGMNVDQWQLEGAPEENTPGQSPYERGIVLALEDVRNNLDANGKIKPSLADVPRNYIEAIPAGDIDNLIDAVSGLLEIAVDIMPDERCHIGFKPGDMCPNFYPRKK
jgi:hypothetical protein